MPPPPLPTWAENYDLPMRSSVQITEIVGDADPPVDDRHDFLQSNQPPEEAEPDQTFLVRKECGDKKRATQENVKRRQSDRLLLRRLLVTRLWQVKRPD